ncbi:MAG: prepilin-type N-terminal cleavage/methylation domain-containing protein [Terriglobales bacterium]
MISKKKIGKKKIGTEKIVMKTIVQEMTNKSRISRDGKRAQSGFSLLEVVISMAVLTVGMVSLLGVFGLAMASTQTSQLDQIAKQLADESYESTVTARNTTQINWDDIQNVGSTNCTITGANSCGIFLSGMQAIYNAGADGIYGTQDDAAAGAQTLQDPGPDGVFLTADDTFIPLTGFQRSIAISGLTDANGNTFTSVRNITITVQYVVPQTKTLKTYILSSYISQFN